MNRDDDVSHLIIARSSDFSESPPNDPHSIFTELRTTLDSGRAVTECSAYVALAAQLMADSVAEYDRQALNSLREELVRTLAAIRRSRSERDEESSLTDRSSELYAGFDALVRVSDPFLARWASVSLLAPGSLPAYMLSLIVRCSDLTSGEIADELKTGKTQVSRAARKLREGGLAYSTPIWTYRFWRATPRGVAADREIRHQQVAGRGRHDLVGTLSTPDSEPLATTQYGDHLMLVDATVVSSSIMQEVRVRVAQGMRSE